MDVKKVLFISQEIDPYLPETPLGVFSRELATGLQEKGAEVRSFMPRYGAINERRNQLHEVIRLSGLNIIINDTDHPLIIKVATLQPARLQVYFIDNDDFFYRHNSKLETIEWAELNDERTIFFVRGTIETVRKLRWESDLVVCTGWISALTPLYLKTVYSEDPAFRHAKIVYNLFNEPFPCPLNNAFADKLREEGFSGEQLADLLAPDGSFDALKMNKIAMDYADAITVSSDDIDPAIIEYAKASGKPFLPYNPDGGTDYYRDFYNSL